MTRELEATIGNRSRRLFEFTMALGIMLLGIQLTLSPESVLRQGGALGTALNIAPPIVWTMAAVILGTARVMVVFINGVWPLSPVVRWSMSLISLGLWTSLAAGYWMALPASKGFPSLILSVICLVVEANCFYALSALRADKRRAE